MILKCEILRKKITFKTKKLLKEIIVKFIFFPPMIQMWNQWIEYKFIQSANAEILLYTLLATFVSSLYNEVDEK